MSFFFFFLGALCAICDVDEYRKCVKEVNSNLIITLFDTLYALCNLLLVKPENLDQVCCDETLVNIKIHLHGYILFLKIALCFIFYICNKIY